jgi:hypothetical protein
MKMRKRPFKKVESLRLRNEDGAVAIISVIILSLVLVTTLSTLYVYIVNRAKYHARIREVYHRLMVIEQGGKILRQAYSEHEASNQDGASGNCPAGSTYYQVSGKDRPLHFCFESLVDEGSRKRLTFDYLGQSYDITLSEATGAKHDHPGARDLQFAGGEAPQDTKLAWWSYRLQQFFDSTPRPDTRLAASLGQISKAKLMPPSLFGWVINQARANTNSDTAEEICDLPEFDCAQNCKGMPPAECLEACKEANGDCELCTDSHSGTTSANVHPICDTSGSVSIPTRSCDAANVANWSEVEKAACVSCDEATTDCLQIEHCPLSGNEYGPNSCTGANEYMMMEQVVAILANDSGP